MLNEVYELRLAGCAEEVDGIFYGSLDIVRCFFDDGSQGYLAGLFALGADVRFVDPSVQIDLGDPVGDAFVKHFFRKGI